MARVAIRAVVNVVPHLAVLFIHTQLVMLVTGRAGEHGKVRGILMALRAGAPFARMSPGVDREPCMVERGPAPPGGVVTRSTRSRESSCHVVRVRDARVISSVTGIAITRGSRVLAANMAVRALHVHMRACQGEPCLVVIEIRGRPCRGAVTDLAGLRESGGCVIRILRIVVVGQVARRTERTQP